MLKLFKSGKIDKKVSGENIKKFLRDRRGQSLIEVLIGLTIGALIIGGVSAGLVSSLRSNTQTKQDIIATEIAQKTMDNLRALSESDWNVIYNVEESVEEGVEKKYYLLFDEPTQTFSALLEPTPPEYLTPEQKEKIEVTIENIIYTPSFYAYNVSRDSEGAIDLGTTYDPSTQKIKVKVSWKTVGTNERTISIASYVTRTKNISTLFTDWSAGSGVEGPVTSANNGFSSSDNLDYSVQGQIKVSGY
jgi:type II secretory pathway pseudopilin PulG